MGLATGEVNRKRLKRFPTEHLADRVGIHGVAPDGSWEVYGRAV
jgi:hypothetical protein